MRLLAILVLFFAATAHADPQAFTTRALFGVDPFGVRGGYSSVTGSDAVFATQSFNVAGRLGATRAATVWLGGELTLAASGRSTAIEPNLFVLFTFERLFRIPLVPMFRVGIGEAQTLANTQKATLLAIDGDVKLGASLYYFITPHVGVGFDANVLAGLGVRPNQCCGYLSVFTDLSAGIRFTR